MAEKEGVFSTKRMFLAAVLIEFDQCQTLDGRSVEGFLDSEDVKTLIKRVYKHLTVTNGDRPFIPNVEDIVQAINDVTWYCQMKIQTYFCELTGKVYYTLTCTDEQTGQKIFKQIVLEDTPENKGLKEMFNLIMTGVFNEKYANFSIPLKECITGEGISKEEEALRREFIKKMIDAQYFAKVFPNPEDTENYEVTLGFRSLGEYKKMLENQLVETCFECNRLLLHGWKCPKKSCGVFIHKACLKKYLNIIKICPSCEHKWSETSMIKRTNPAYNGTTNPSGVTIGNKLLPSKLIKKVEADSLTNGHIPGIEDAFEQLNFKKDLTNGTIVSAENHLSALETENPYSPNNAWTFSTSLKEPDTGRYRNIVDTYEQMREKRSFLAAILVDMDNCKTLNGKSVEGFLDADDVKIIMKKAFEFLELPHPEQLLTTSVQDVVRAINETKWYVQMEILTFCCELTEKEYYTVVHTDEKNGQRIFKEVALKDTPENKGLKEVFNLIMTEVFNENYQHFSIPLEKCVAGDGISEIEEALRCEYINRMIEAQYFAKVFPNPEDKENYEVTLGFRSLGEYQSVLGNKLVEKCYECWNLLLHGWKCPNETCDIYIHKACLKKYLTTIKTCPRCDHEWSETSMIKRTNPGYKGSSKTTRDNEHIPSKPSNQVEANSLTNGHSDEAEDTLTNWRFIDKASISGKKEDLDEISNTDLLSGNPSPGAIIEDTTLLNDKPEGIEPLHMADYLKDINPLRSFLAAVLIEIDTCKNIEGRSVEGIVDVEDAKILMKKVVETFDQYYGEQSWPTNVEEVIRAINNTHWYEAIGIQTYCCELTGKTYYTAVRINEKTGRKIFKQIPLKDTPENKGLKEVFNLIMTEVFNEKYENFSIPLEKCVAGDGISKEEEALRREFINKMIEAQYFAKVFPNPEDTGNYEVTLGFRSLKEYQNEFRNKLVENCYDCWTLLLHGWKCPNETCDIYVHKACLKKCLNIIRICPSCKHKWSETSMIKRTNPAYNGTTNPSGVTNSNGRFPEVTNKFVLKNEANRLTNGHISRVEENLEELNLTEW